ncbi:MAG: efflux RND transporter periplasmic adaptor subunit [candidate division WOR-3 bacterium]
MIFFIMTFIKLDEKLQKKLDIKLYEVKVQEIIEEIRLPAKTEEYTPLVAEIYSPIPGIIRNVFVKQGDYVRKGQVLVSIYSPQLTDIQAKLKVAEENLKREEMLYKEEVIPYSRYYNAKVEYEKIKAEYEALVNSFKYSGEIRGNEIFIKAPISGYISKQEIFLGSSVDISKRMFMIHSHEKIWVYSYARPEESQRIKIGMKGYVIWNNIKVWGYVDYISYELDHNTKRVIIRLLIDNKDDILKIGLPVEAVIQIENIKGIWIPSQALQRISGNYVVFLRVKDGFEIIKVEKIKEKDNMVLIRGNIKEGDKIAVSGTIFLKSQIEKQ